jgi:transcriptional regulator with XRE-family HTH domain
MSDMIHNDESRLDAEEEQERLSRRLREAREYLGLSQEFVAEQLGIPRASLSSIETGKRKVSGVELKQLARLYRRSVASLLEAEISEQEALLEDATVRALFRTTRQLGEQDRLQLLRFAQFLRHQGRTPTPSDDETDPT